MRSRAWRRAQNERYYLRGWAYGWNVAFWFSGAWRGNVATYYARLRRAGVRQPCQAFCCHHLRKREGPPITELRWPTVEEWSEP